MLKIQTLDRPEGFVFGLQLRWLVGHLEKKQMNTPWWWNDKAAGNHSNRDHEWRGERKHEQKVQGLEEVWAVLGTWWFLKVSDHIKAQQSSMGIWFQQINLTSYFGNCYCGVQSNCSKNANCISPVRCQFWGMTLGFCFILFLQEHNDHSSVCPCLCVSTSFW